MSGKKSYYSIQYLRAVAALFVVFHHARNPHPWLYGGLANYGNGQAGVDVFFVISGFIMYTAARSEPAVEFARRRLVRIVPLYWIATLFAFFILGHRDPQVSVSQNTTHLLLSLFFVPHFSPNRGLAIFPYLVPGWTLVYEMFFYVLFAIGLSIGSLQRFLITSVLVLSALGMLYTGQNAIVMTYTDAILLEFLAGFLIARFSDVLVSRWSAALLPLGAVALLIVDPAAGPRPLIWGVPACCVVIGALALERNGIKRQHSILLFLGNASYSIYLFQIIGINAAARIIQKLPISGPVQLIAMVIASIAGACVVGGLIHIFIEKPVTRFILKPGRKSALAATD